MRSGTVLSDAEIPDVELSQGVEGFDDWVWFMNSRNNCNQDTDKVLWQLIKNLNPSKEAFLQAFNDA